MSRVAIDPRERKKTSIPKQPIIPSAPETATIVRTKINWFRLFIFLIILFAVSYKISSMFFGK